MPRRPAQPVQQNVTVPTHVTVLTPVETVPTPVEDLALSVEDVEEVIAPTRNVIVPVYISIIDIPEEHHNVKIAVLSMILVLTVHQSPA